MEILKFDESASSSPSRKRSGRGAILVTFVALVFGAGTALASGTLTINNTNTIALDQGVANSVQCDNAIGVTLNAPYNTDDGDFYLTSIVVSGIDTRTKSESSLDDDKNHCLGKDFNLKVYDSEGNLSEFCVGANAVTDAANEDPSRTITADAGCAADGKSAKLQVVTNNPDDPTNKTANTLTYSFTKKMRTGETSGLVRVQNVTIESSDHI
jgi:hypothetical protein